MPPGLLIHASDEIWHPPSVVLHELAARTSWKRVLRHQLGLKAPRGYGWLTNPRRAAYNRVYSRTSVSLRKLLSRLFGGQRTIARGA